MYKTCPNCNAENRDTARFCSVCATPLPAQAQQGGIAQSVCPQCGKSNRAGARFCSNCAAPLSAARSPRRATGQMPPQSILADRYLILEKLGQGGMGAVYKAADTRLPGKLWAVKEMSDAAITDPLERKRASQNFHHEARLLVDLDHPNIPKITDSFSDGGKKYLVMEFVEGETLAQRLHRLGNRPLPPDTVVNLGLQLCSALDYMHNQNPPIIFRDLKPGNVMLTPNGQVKLIDFGIARLFKSGKKKDTQSFGTAGYAPPEQYGHGQTDARSDIYALGATLHHLLTGVDPANSPFSFTAVCTLNPAVSPQVDAVVMRAVSQSPQERWQSIAEMQAALGVPVVRPHESWRDVQDSTPGIGIAIKARGTSRPTARLVAAAANLSNTQLAAAISVLLLLTVVGVWFGAPAMRRVPLLWNNLPLIAVVGPLAYAATQRRWVTFAMYTPVAFLGGVALWQRVTYRSENYAFLLLAAVVSGLFMEGWLVLLPKVKGKQGDEAWKREIIWLALMAAVSVFIFYALPMLLSSGKIPRQQVGEWIGAALLGSVGWFLGDSFHQYLFQRQTGLKRNR